MAAISQEEKVRLAHKITPNNMSTIALQYMGISIETLEEFEKSHPGDSLRVKIACFDYWCNINGSHDLRKMLYDVLKKAQSEGGLLDLKTFEFLLEESRESGDNGCSSMNSGAFHVQDERRQYSEQSLNDGQVTRKLSNGDIPSDTPPKRTKTDVNHEGISAYPLYWVSYCMIMVIE